MIRNKRKEIILTLLTLTVGLLVLINSRLFFHRFDVTENKVFTISQVSRDVFQEAEEPLRVIYYVSDKLRQYSPLPTQIEDLLREYAAQSRGKMTLEMVDPVLSGRVNEAERAGILPQQIQIYEEDQQSVAKVYSGILLRYRDRREVLPLAVRVETLEYDLTSRLRHLIRNERSTVAVMAGSAAKDLNRDYSYMLGMLRESYDVKVLNREEPIPPEADALILLGNKDITDDGARRINNFLLGGGRVFFGAEGVAMDLQGNEPPVPGDDPLLELLDEYGVRVRPALLQDQYAKVIQYQTQQGMSLGRYSLWIQIAGRNVSAESPVTHPFTGLDLFWASPLSKAPGSSGDLEVLASASPAAWTMENYFMIDPARVSPQPPSPGGASSYPVMMAYTGQGKAPDSPEENPGGAVRFLVMGDSDFASNYIQMADSPYNLDFLGGALQWLLNEEDLLSIRNRSARDMTLSGIQEPGARESWIFLTYLTTMILVPLGVAFYGILRYLRRRRETRRQYTREVIHD